MSSWAGGYVADIEYIQGYYRQQAPPHMALAGLLGGVDTRWPPNEDAAHYLEIGSGRGLNSLLLAASNPDWQVTAVDYNPAHIAEARELARRAGLANVVFLEADLTTLAETGQGVAIPPAHYVSLHGVWSWVSPAVRSGIVRLLREKVLPGGLVQVSYNVLPAWHGTIALQRVIFEAGRRAPGRSDRQVSAGLDLARALAEAKAEFLVGDGFAHEFLGTADSMPVQYLAHEFMNAHWRPCFHADVAAELAEAKLQWAASVNLLETFPDLMLRPEIRAIYDKLEDPIMQELVKDTALPRQLRNDLFVRGARRLSSADRDAALRDITLALTVSEHQVDYALQVPAGSGELGPAFKSMVEALATGPKTVGELLSLVPGRSSPAEAAGILVGTNQALPVARPDASQGQAADRLNALLAQHARLPSGRESGVGLASVRLGAALPVGWLEQFVFGRLRLGEGLDQLDAWVGRLAPQIRADKLDEMKALLQRIVQERADVFRLLT